MNRRDALARTAWMLGVVLSAPTIQAMSRWEAMTATGKMFSRSGSILTETQREVVARVAETILPRTDTPGALDVGVPDFIDLMLSDCYKKPAQEAFLAGIADLERKGFLTLTPDQQTALLNQTEADARKTTDPSFWTITKELTIWGYFTSEAGIKASLDYQPIPGKFVAIKIKPGQKDFMYGNQI